ncbi:maleylpyruvate isomerase N-terminal domain-containing protein [Actinosynnema sp. CA-248983]
MAGWNPPRWTEKFTEQAAMFREAVGKADPEAKVPSCPGWTFTELTLHVGRFLQTSLEYLRSGSTVRLNLPPAPQDVVPLEYLDAQLALAAEVLPAVPGNRPAWTFSPASPDLAWVWHRRIAHELDLRRWDAQAALRELVSGDTDFAVDGIEESLGTLLAAKYATDVPRPPRAPRSSSSPTSPRPGWSPWSPVSCPSCGPRGRVRRPTSRSPARRRSCTTACGAGCRSRRPVTRACSA